MTFYNCNLDCNLQIIVEDKNLSINFPKINLFIGLAHSCAIALFLMALDWVRLIPIKYIFMY